MPSFDNVIISVDLPFGDARLDLELPAFYPVESLAPKLLETLKLMQPQYYASVHGIELLWRDQTLHSGDTLASVGIWDGSILKIKEME